MPAAAHGSTTSKIFFRNPIPACAGRPISSASLWQRYSSLVERIGGDSSRGHLKICCLRSLLVFSVARPQELREGAAPTSVPSMSCVPDAILIHFPRGTGYNFKKDFPGIDCEIRVPIQTFWEKPFAHFFERCSGCPQPPRPVQYPRFFFLNPILACADRPISLP